MGETLIKVQLIIGNATPTHSQILLENGGFVKNRRRFKMPFQDVGRLLQPLLKQARTEAGGAPFQIEATKQLAQIFKLALKELKEH